MDVQLSGLGRQSSELRALHHLGDGPADERDINQAFQS